MATPTVTSSSSSTASGTTSSASSSAATVTTAATPGTVGAFPLSPEALAAIQSAVQAELTRALTGSLATPATTVGKHLFIDFYLKHTTHVRAFRTRRRAQPAGRGTAWYASYH